MSNNSLEPNSTWAFRVRFAPSGLMLHFLIFLLLSFQEPPNTTVILWDCLSGAVSQLGKSSVLKAYPEECLGVSLASGMAEVAAFGKNPKNPVPTLCSVGRGFGAYEVQPSLESLNIRRPSCPCSSEWSSDPGVWCTPPFLERQAALLLQGCNKVSARQLNLRAAIIRTSIVPCQSF